LGTGSGGKRWWRKMAILLVIERRLGSISGVSQQWDFQLKKGQAPWPALPPHNHIPSLLSGHPFPKSGLNPRAGFLPDPD